MRSFFFLIFVLSFSVTSAHANCESPIDYEAYSGNWTLVQGPGGVVGTDWRGAIATPLPSQGALSLKLEMRADGAGVLSGTPGQQIVMFPVAAERVDQVISFLQDVDASVLAATADDCPATGLPNLVGNNLYFMDGFDQSTQTSAYAHLGDDNIVFCDRNPLMTLAFEHEGDPLAPYFFPAHDTPRYFDACHGRNVGAGAMIITLAVQFSSSTAGSGVVYFDGAFNGVEFTGRAPVTLSR